MVLHIPQPFLCNPDHLGGMRLGFGVAGLKAGKPRFRSSHFFFPCVEEARSTAFLVWKKLLELLSSLEEAQGAERKERLETILEQIMKMQGSEG